MKIEVLKHEKGMVLIIVIAAIMLMTIAVVGMLSRNVSQSLRDEKMIQRMQAELLAKGAFWRVYQNGGTPPADFTETVDGRNYTVTYTTAAGAGPSGTGQIITNVVY